MTQKIARRIRGNLHGSIDITTIEDAVIAHPVFQRLRRIQQTAFLSLVFPGATHTRFEHSLGVLNLASKALDKLIGNQERLDDKSPHSHKSNYSVYFKESKKVLVKAIYL